MKKTSIVRLTLAGVLALAVSSCSTTDREAEPMKSSIEKKPFGKLPDGTEIDEYTLRNTRGAVAKIITYGALMTELHVPDREGKIEDIVLGFDNLQQYLAGHPYFGATVGRYANRIALGKFTLDGQSYQLATNDGPNHLHGGVKGFDKVVWQAAPATTAEGVAVEFTYVSRDGEDYLRVGGTKNPLGQCLIEFDPVVVHDVGAGAPP